MSDEITVDDDAEAETLLAEAVNQAETVTDSDTQEDPAAQLAKWKALARQNEARAKANADKARLFDEFEESNKTELQKALDRAAALETDAATAKLDALRARTASATGVPEALLHGTTVEELQASADAAKAYAKAQAPAAPHASGSELGGTGEQGQITSEQLAHMSPEETVKALESGKLAHLL